MWSRLTAKIAVTMAAVVGAAKVIGGCQKRKDLKNIVWAAVAEKELDVII